jgi:hypothetical protein
MAVVSRPFERERPTGARRTIRFTSLLTLVTYLLAFLAIAVVLQQAMVWGQRRLDDLRYGFPRSAHTSGIIHPEDAMGMPTQIITLNIDGQVSTLVLPGGDAAGVQVLEGPYLVGRDGPYAVPHPTLQDINGDGQVDLLVMIRGEAIVYMNEQGTLRIITPEERAALMGAAQGEPAGGE